MEQFSIEARKSNPGLHKIYLNTLYDWPKKLEPIRQRIRVKTKTNHDFIARVFQRSMLVVFFCFEFFLAPGHISFNAIDHCDYFGFGIRNSLKSAHLLATDKVGKKPLKLQLFSKKKSESLMVK